MRKKICFVSARPGSIKTFLSNHIAALANQYDIYMVANFSDQTIDPIPGVKETYNVEIMRPISIAADLKAVNKLTKYFKKMKFDAVHSLTPKAGLITALAAKRAGIKERTHVFTGQVWATRKGVMRKLLKAMDRVIVGLDNHILVDGESQRQYLIKNKIVKDSKSRVLGAGSICGVDTERFNPTLQERKKQREALGLSDDKIVFAFMGRLNRDKGVYELFQAFNDIVPYCPNAYLLIYGGDEGNCLSNLKEYQNIVEGMNFKYCGSTKTPEYSLQAADIFVLPTYREGFGMSIIEASCLELPVICSDAYGVADTIVDNETGVRCKVGDVPSLVEAMEFMYNNPQERKRMGENGRRRVLDLFASNKIVQAWVDFYNEILK